MLRRWEAGFWVAVVIGLGGLGNGWPIGGGAAAWAAPRHGAATQPRADVVWQIGTFDDDYRELGKTHDYHEYLKHYPRSVVFVVGRSTAREDWPFIHPGPADRFAKRKAHAFTVRFDLDAPPSDRYLLRVDLVATHYRLPPTLTLCVNDAEGKFATPKGPGDASLKDPSKGREHVIDVPFSGTLLRRGTNRIVILNDSGSHVLYDALALYSDRAATTRASRLIAEPTPMYVETDAGLARLARVRILGPAGQRGGKLSIRAADREITQAVEPVPLGDASIEARFPLVDEAAKATLELRSGDERVTADMVVRPAKKWRLFITPTVHTDIGYTHHQSEVALRQNKNTEQAIRICQEVSEYRFKLECTWSALQYERHRGPQAMATLMSLVRQGRIGVEADYANMLTGLCSPEELIRMLYPAADLMRRFGIPFESVTQNDTPSQVWSLPSVLHHAGVKYLTIGVNNNETRAPILRKGLDKRSPFWWEGPDGSRTLTWLTKGYVAAYYTGLIRSLAEAEKKLPVWLKPWQERDDYPYDAILLHGAYSDNWQIDGKLAETVSAWNAKYAYPKLILSSSGEFFDYVLGSHADKIPTVRGCGGCYWEDGAASSARATAVNRNNHQRIVTAEALWALLRSVDLAEEYPRERIAKTWKNILLFDEHTWGARRWGLDPEHHTVKEQWETKRGFALDAQATSRALLDEGMERLARSVSGDGKGVVVFNPTSWTRSDVVRVTVPRGTGLVGPYGRPVAVQELSIEEDGVVVCFVARDVPAIGYRRYDVVHAEPVGPRMRPTSAVPQYVENRFYRVALDDRSGGIVSLVDKQTGRELIDKDSPYAFGEVIYAEGGAKTTAIAWRKGYPPAEFELSTPSAATWQIVQDGPVLRSVRSRTRAKMLPQIGIEVTLYEDVKRIDLTAHLDKVRRYEMEAVYIAFPLAAKEPEFRLETGGAWVRPEEDMLPGACLDWFCTQYGVLLDTGDGRSVNLAPLDTPLIQLCAINTGKWLQELPITNGTVFAYVMNNYWLTNYRPGQGGKHVFRFSLTSGEKLTTADATRHGWGAARPIVARPCKDGFPIATLQDQGMFCRIEPPNVVMTALKRAEDGEGLIIRVLEVGGRRSRVRIACDLLPRPSEAWRCDGVERKVEPLPVDGGAVRVSIAPHGLETIRLLP